MYYITQQRVMMCIFVVQGTAVFILYANISILYYSTVYYTLLDKFMLSVLLCQMGLLYCAPYFVM